MKIKKKIICFMLISAICVNNVQVANANPFIGTLPEIAGTVGSIASPEIALVFLMVAGFGIATNVICPDDPKKLGDDVRALGKKTEECILKSLDNMDKEGHKEIENREENKKAIDSFLAKMCEGTIQTSSKGFKLIKYYVDEVLHPKQVEVDTSTPFETTVSDMPTMIMPTSNYLVSSGTNISGFDQNYYVLDENGNENYMRGLLERGEYGSLCVGIELTNENSISVFNKAGISFHLCKTLSYDSSKFTPDILVCYKGVGYSLNYCNADYTVKSDSYLKRFSFGALINLLIADGVMTEELAQAFSSVCITRFLIKDNGNKTYKVNCRPILKILNAFDSYRSVEIQFKDIILYLRGVMIAQWGLDVVGEVNLKSLPWENFTTIENDNPIVQNPDIPEEYDVSKAKDTDLTKAKENDLTQDIPVPTDITDETLPDVVPLWNVADSSIVLDYPDVTNPDPSNPDPSNPENPDKTDLENPDQDLAPYSFDLRNLFPFCLPFDLYKFIKLFQAEPKAPKFTWKFPTIGKKGVIQYSDLTIDLKQFDSVAKLVRGLFDILFILGLIFATRKTFLRG